MYFSIFSKDGEARYIFPVHSSIPLSEQQQIFQRYVYPVLLTSCVFLHSGLLCGPPCLFLFFILQILAKILNYQPYFHSNYSDFPVSTEA